MICIYVNGDRKSLTITDKTFKKDQSTKAITTVETKKELSATFGKRILLSDLSSVPFGYDMTLIPEDVFPIRINPELNEEIERNAIDDEED